MVKTFKEPEEKEDKEVTIIIPGREQEDARSMAKFNGFTSVKTFLQSRYTIALRTYLRKQKIEED